MSLRFGAPNYLNTLPLLGGLLQGEVKADIEWVLEVPSQLNKLLSEGELDVGLISSYHYLTHQDDLALLPGLCIAAVDEVQSVLLYKRNGLEKIDGQTVAITDESTSAVQLLKVLAHRFWNVAPHYVPLTNIEEATTFPAFLLIGDAALEKSTYPGYYTVDLATAWHEKTGLPIPFALFAAPKKVMEKRGDEIHSLMRQLSASYKWATRNEGAILDMACKRTSVDRERLKAYYNLLHYKLGEQELAGLRTFAALSDVPCHALV